jgi:hypothetical protein
MYCDSGGNWTIPGLNYLSLYTSTADGGGLILQNVSNNTSGTVVLFRGWNNTTTGSISTYVNVTIYATSSDYRLKENIVDLTGATERLKQIPVHRFNWIADPEGNSLDGFLAHEVAAIVPEAVVGKKDAVYPDVYPEGSKNAGKVHPNAGQIDPQGIDQSKLVPLLVKTIQELEARITALEGA